jgi:hypothetical protein
VGDRRTSRRTRQKEAGHRVQKRSQKRNKRYLETLPPSNELEEALYSSTNDLLAPLSPPVSSKVGSSKQERPLSASYMNPSTLEKQERKLKRDKAKLKSYEGETPSRSQLEVDALIRSHATSHILGSSQLEGCRGDFCHFDTSVKDTKLSDSEMGQMQRDEFRRKLLNMPDVYGGMNADGSLGGEGSDAFSLNDSDSIFSYGHKPSSHQTTPLEASSMSPRHQIPYKSIIQARKELSLVKTFLLKYKQGIPHDYVSEGNAFDNLSIGQNYPAHYYKDVNVCHNCFKVYTLIDQARDVAKSKIERRRAGENQRAERKGRPVNDQLGLHPKKSRSQRKKKGEKGGHGSYSSPKLMEQHQKAVRIAQLAIQSISKLDVAEIRAFSSPPTPVKIVMEALLYLITGERLTWEEAKRFLTKSDVFMKQLVTLSSHLLSSSSSESESASVPD